MITRTSQAIVATALILSLAGVSRAADWTPVKWANEDTIKLCTKPPAGVEYCFPVWMVVLNGEVFVRLGTKAAERMDKVGRSGGGISARTGEALVVEIAGQRFDRVDAVVSPGEAKHVAAAMAAKYWMDLVVRYLPHPMTVMLAPDVVVP